MFTDEFRKAAFSSVTEKWNTPQTLIDDLATVFNWDLDVCASRSNVCNSYFDKNQNGLKLDWLGLCWMNPPYGREIGTWINKAWRESRFNFCTVVCLLPARTDTKWFHNKISSASLIVFIKGRLKFGSAINSAPFPSMFVVFGDGLNLEQENKLSSYGMAWQR